MDNNTTNMMSRAEVAKYVIGLKDAQAGFLGFVKMMYPEWSLPDFQLELVDVLDKLEKNSLGCENVLITMPPRHAKSTFGTILFPSWFMGRDPKRQVMSSSYNCLLYTSPSPRDKRQSRMPSSA